MSARTFLFVAFLGFAAAAQQGTAAAQPSAPASPSQNAARQQQEQQQSNAAAAAAAGAGAVIVSEQLASSQDPFAFPAPSSRARQWLGYASPWTLIHGEALSRCAKVF